MSVVTATLTPLPDSLEVGGPERKVTGVTIKDQIFERMGELTPAEKKVARALLASYPSAGLGSAASLAKSAGTSTPTVLRLVTRLGIGSYPDFQELLRDEVTSHMNSPVSRTQRARPRLEQPGLFGDSIASKTALVETVAASVPPSEFERAVRALADKPRHIAISGGYFTRFLAQFFAAQLDQATTNVVFVNEPLGHDMGKYLDLGPGSVAVILDFRRYELASKQAAETAKEQGATVIVITDQDLSPAVDAADIVLPVTVDGVPFDSMVSVLALLEALVEAVLVATGDRGLKRMKQWEDSVHIARAYRAAALNSSAPLIPIEED